ncbi:S26 family signal peptidase [Acetobacter sp. DsW_063]|uniref:S26 family signal peptidase n=1 Tax=Acetobacter sp. DsW_063 TaxID=1514894 RepID=UPI000A3A3C58|nr:S26 family signal peptidase [Acetobacter sp. DsW_063]OUJ14560.1 conjugal transfer protein TraF [Acetobacter sp. DsW_063]
MTRRGWFFATYFAVLGTLATVELKPAPKLIWNATASVPTGLYRLTPERVSRTGDIVAIRLPEPTGRLLSARGYLPSGVPLLKPVAAVGGQTVCRTGLHITIDGTAIGDAKPVDHRGRPLPVWRGCVRLSHDQIFVMNPAVPTSLDGRYFGPLPVSAVLGRAIPVWIRTRQISSQPLPHGGQ